jgi:hypothetical protein
MATIKVPVEIQLNGIWVVELQDITNNPFEEWYIWSVFPNKERAELSCKLQVEYNATGGMSRYQTRTRMTRVPFNLEFEGNNSTEDFDIIGVYSSEEKARIGLANVILNTKPPVRRCNVQVDFRIEEHNIDHV